MTYEAWRISYQSSEQAARAAYAECVQLYIRLEAAEKERDELRAKIETAENDAAHQKALADSALRVAEGWERKCGELRAALQHETDCVEAAKAEIDALRAKIERMEQPESGFRERCTPAAPAGGSNRFPLYALPGAQGE